MNWTMEASEKCNFVVYCYQLAAPDCLTFKGDRGGVCTWNTILAECQNPASQPWVTSKVTSSEIVGCRFFQTSFDCSRASPIDPSSGCMWDDGVCVDVDGSKPSRIQQTCRRDYVIDQAQDKTIVDSISQIQEVAESYHANSTAPEGPTPSSLDLTGGQLDAHRGHVRVGAAAGELVSGGLRGRPAPVRQRRPVATVGAHHQTLLREN